MYCQICRDEFKTLNDKVNNAVKNIKFSSYTDDMGGENREFLTSFNFV
jgi:hypothetical protein